VGEEVSSLSGWWSSIGERIARRWDVSGRHEESFPEVAAEVLAGSPAPLERLAAPSLGWLADAELPQQHNLGTGFGQPAVTVFRDEGFIVYLLFWFDETITIHDHRFSGAFSVIEGRSLQNVYEFEEGAPLWPGIREGALRCTKVETLGPGDVRLIPPGTGLIHSNFHFGYPSPTVSLVARTLVKGEAQQHFYSKGGLAFADQGPSPETVKRLQGFEASCRISPELGVDFLRRALADAAPHEALAYVAAVTSYFGSTLYLAPYIAESSLGEPGHARQLVLDYARQLYTGLAALAELRGLVDNSQRLLMSMVAAGTEWGMATEAIGAALPGVEPRVALCRLVSDVVEHARSSGRASACQLSGRTAGYLKSLASSDNRGVVPAPPAEGIYTELVTHRLFGPMFRFALPSSDAAG
jgi:hypothetical protein